MLTERAKKMIPRYEAMFSCRGGVTPTDPLEFHLYHLARYWNRMVGFIRQAPDQPEHWIEHDLGACIEVGTQFVNHTITPDSKAHDDWANYWNCVTAMLYERPVVDEDIEQASRDFEKCLAALNYDPWSNKTLDTNP